MDRVPIPLILDLPLPAEGCVPEGCDLADEAPISPQQADPPLVVVPGVKRDLTAEVRDRIWVLAGNRVRVEFVELPEFHVGGRADPVRNTYQVPKGGLGGISGGWAQEATLRKCDLLEDNPTPMSRAGMKAGAQAVPFIGAAQRAVTGTDVLGDETSRVEAILDFGLQVAPFAPKLGPLLKKPVRLPRIPEIDAGLPPTTVLADGLDAIPKGTGAKHVNTPDQQAAIDELMRGPVESRRIDDLLDKMGVVGGKGPDDILFGQKAAGARFTTKEAGSTFEFAGELVADVAEGLKSGRIHPDQIPVEYVMIKGRRVAVNTRSMAAFDRAGVEPTRIIDKTADSRVVRKVQERLEEMGGNPRDTIDIRPDRRR